MTTNDRSSIARSQAPFVAALLALAAVLRFFWLGHQSIWVDEALTLIVSTPKPGYPLWTLISHNIHGPLHALVVYLVQLIHGGDAWLRMPSAVAGVAAVGVFYAWAQRWFDRPTARLAALLLALDPLHVRYSQEVRNYAFVVLFGLLACYAFDRFSDRPTRRAGVAYVLAMAAAVLSNFIAAFLFAAHTAIYFVRHGFHGTVWKRWVSVGVLVLVLVSPWVYRVYTYIDVSELVTPVTPGQLDNSERLRGETTVSPSAVPYTFYTFAAGFSLGPSLRELHEDATMRGVLSHHWPVVAWVSVLFGGLFIWGLSRYRNRGRLWFELCVYLVFPLLFTLILTWQNAKAFNPRYVLLALPAWLCFVAAGARALPRMLSVAATAACALTMLVSLTHYYFDGNYARDDVRSAVRYVEKQMDRDRSDECVLAPTVDEVVRHYRTGNYEVHVVFQRQWLARDRVDAQLASLFAACNSLWYIRARPWVDDWNNYVIDTLESRYRVSEQVQFDGVKVIHLVR